MENFPVSLQYGNEEAPTSLLDVSSIEIIPDIIEWPEYVHFKAFRDAELFGHNLAYQPANNARERLTIETSEYEAVHIYLQEGKVIGKIFIPVENNPSSDIHFAFTGTSSLSTMLADLEDCPGEESFQKAKTELFQLLANAIEEVSARTGAIGTLTIHGHSLGGALAQQFTAEIARYLSPRTAEKLQEAESAYHAYHQRNYGITETPLDAAVLQSLQKIPALNCHVWNSAGISKAAMNLSNACEPSVPTHLRAGLVGGDGVQCTGEANIFVDNDHGNVQISVLKADCGQEGLAWKSMGVGAMVGGLMGGVPGMLLGGASAMAYNIFKATKKAHTIKHYKDGKSVTPDTFQLLESNNATDKTSIGKELKYKSAFLQNSLVRFFQRGASKVGNWVVPSNKTAIYPDLIPGKSYLPLYVDNAAAAHATAQNLEHFLDAPATPRALSKIKV